MQDLHSNMEFTNSASDFIKIIWYFDEEFDLEIDSFQGVQNAFDEYGWALEGVDTELFKLRFALQYYDENSISFIIDNKDCYDLRHIINDIEPGYFPLMEAVSHKKYEQAEFLLKSGANPNQGNEPWFPLMQADINRDLQMIELLEQYGADWEHNTKVYEHWNNEVFIKVCKIIKTY